jgi:hypothetical protein
VPAQNLKEFVAYAKSYTGKLSYAHVGVGSTPQLIGEMFKLQAGLPELVQREREKEKEKIYLFSFYLFVFATGSGAHPPCPRPRGVDALGIAARSRFAL